MSTLGMILRLVATVFLFKLNSFIGFPNSMFLVAPVLVAWGCVEWAIWKW